VLCRAVEEQPGARYELERRGVAWRPLGFGSNVLADDGASYYVIGEFERIES